MNVLDLFSGTGGFSLGLERAGMKTVAFCEIDPSPQAILRKNFPGVPIYGDVRTVTADRLRADGISRVDVVCGGWPCQPFSVAGERRGQDDDRHLWPEVDRIVQEFNPTWLIGENVTGFIDLALEETCLDLENAGYEVQPLVIPACAVGAFHRRDRVWILAHSKRKGRQGCQQDDRVFGTTKAPFAELGDRIAESWCEVAERVRGLRSSDGLSVQMVRNEVKAYGNAVVPLIPEILGRAVMGVEMSLHQNNPNLPHSLKTPSR